jgi:hypothetical protein
MPKRFANHSLAKPSVSARFARPIRLSMVPPVPTISADADAHPNTHGAPAAKGGIGGAPVQA